MALVVPNVGEVLLLSYSLNKIAPGETVKLKLYKNDVIPDEDTIVGDFTEADTNGYPAGGIDLAKADWIIATDIGVTTAEQPQKTFTLTGAGSHYGYYITDTAGTGLLWAEKFSDAPHTIPSGGGTEKITVKLIGE